MAITNGPKLGIMIDALSGDAHPNDFRKVLRALDALMFLSVISMTTNAQPGSPADGDRYLITAAPTGTDWSGKTQGLLAVYSTHITTTSGGVDTTVSGWEFYTPKRNWQTRVEDAADVIVLYSGTVWV